MNKYNKKSDDQDAKFLLLYINDVLLPSSNDFFYHLDNNSVKLHHVFSFNTILTHAIDYIVFIAKKNMKASRSEFISHFDKRYYVDGCKHINNKFALLDAINNSFKHVELDKKRYADLITEYGDLSFHSLKYDNGKVFFNTPSYRFDYSRVILRPITAIFDCGLKDTNDIDDFINGRKFGATGYGHFDYDYVPHEAIDRMLDNCNPECMGCGENSENCDCPSFIYGQNNGDFIPNTDPNFDFANVMSSISGTREWNKSSRK